MSIYIYVNNKSNNRHFQCNYTMLKIIGSTVY